MPAAIRKGVDNSQGHCFEPRPADQGSGNVFTNNIMQVRETDHYPTHTCGSESHDGNALDGTAPNVLVNTLKIHVNGDPIDCGDTAANGSPNVFAASLNGAGAVIENGRIINIPGYGSATSSSGFFFEHDDEDSPGTPPGDTTTRPMEEQQSDDTQPPSTPVPTQDCSTVDALPNNFSWTDVSGSFSTWAQSFQLSPMFTVASLTINTSFPHSFTSSPTQPIGLTQKQILQNMCFLAKTVLEPILAAYGSFLITSGWRPNTNNSQHNKGQAADIQFTAFHSSGMTGTQYFQRAQNVRDTINFDQMILEWFGNNPWIHVSANPAGHRNSVLTQVSQNSYSAGLKLLRAS